MKNLLPEVCSQWSEWSPREVLKPAMKREGDKLFFDSEGKFEKYGKWMNEKIPVREGASYDFSVGLLTENVASPETSAYVLISWLDKNGDWVAREYVTERKKSDGGWIELYRGFTAPDESAFMICELCFRWSAGGKACYRAPKFYETEAAKKRIVRVAAAYTSLPVPRTVEGNARAIFETLVMAGAHEVDFVCLSEVINADGVGLPTYERSVPVPGPLTEQIGEYAKKYNMYVIIGLSERDGDLCHNVAALIGRDGKYIGKYLKMQLPLAEAEEGYTPGSEYSVFDTDFGKVGMMICWDQGYPEIARGIATAGAEIIFVPTMWYADIEARTRAAENNIYVVTSARPHDEYPARIIDPTGAVIAIEKGSRGRQRGICFADIDLNERFYTRWLSVGPCDGERSAFRAERRYDAYGPSILPMEVK